MKYLVIFLFLVGMTVSSLFVNEAYGSVVEIEFDDMVHQSDLVLIGNITNIEPTYEVGAFGSLKDQFFHDVTLDIEMTLFRDISITEISFRIQKDRSLGEQTADISTSQDFEIGEKVLVFLAKETDDDYWDDQYHVLGLHQGKYSLVNGKAFGSHFNGISEDDLISKIYEIKRGNKITKHSLDSSFQLSYNQTGLVANQLYITFTELKEDSRCPSDVTCIWQGRASVQFDFRDGKYSTQKILSVGGDSSPSAIVFDRYKIELLDIKPKPVSTNSITKSDYEVTVMVTKSGFIPSPLKQSQSGIPFNEIQCKQNLVLIQKYDRTPACVTESTKLKLIERGWTNDTLHEPTYFGYKIKDIESFADSFCPNNVISENKSGVFLTCIHSEDSPKKIKLPPPTYKLKPCASTYGCMHSFVWAPHIPANLISDGQKQDIVDMLLQFPETKNWPSEPILDHFLVSSSEDNWHVNVQFFIEGVKMPQHNKCEYYDSATLDLETLEIINGFRDFDDFEECKN